MSEPKPSARDILRGKDMQYRTDPCCAVPIDKPAPECPWHNYRSLMVSLAAHDLPEEVCAHALKCETTAQVHALEFVRGTVIAKAQQEAADGFLPMEIMAKLTHRLNHIISELKK